MYFRKSLSVPFPEVNGKIEPALGDRSGTEAEAVLQSLVDVELGGNAHRVMRRRMVRRLAMPSESPTQANVAGSPSGL